MRKLYYLCVVVTLLLCSCSGDDGASGSGYSIDGTKLRRTISTLGGTVVTGETIYDGNKIISTTSSDGTSFHYTYTGNLITKMEFYRDGNIEDTTVLNYNNDKLTGYTSLRGDAGYRVAYTYNNDGTISIAAYTGDLTNQNNQTDLNKKVFFQDGLVIAIEEYKIINGNPEILRTSYTHDNANSPSSGILGHDKLTMYDQGVSNYSHNVTSITKTATNSSEVYVSNITYLYNASNLPYKMTYGNMIIEYFYE